MTTRKKSLEKPMDVSHSDVCGANLCSPTPAVSGWKDLGNPVSMTYNEAIQGCCNNCYFIAALSSVAWAVPNELDVWGTYYFNGEKVTLPHQEVPVDASNNPVYARLPPSGDNWAMLYEVAYAKWKSGSDYPDIAGTIGNGGSGFQAMKEITGYQFPANPFEITDGTDPDVIWGNILTGGVLKRGVYDTYKTTHPSFAETKPDLGSGINGIYKSHTYSLFGKVVDTSTGKKYIVLRNPYATYKPEPDADVIRPAINFFGVNLAASNDGVFALELSKFKAYFKKYGSAKKVA